MKRSLKVLGSLGRFQRRAVLPALFHAPSMNSTFSDWRAQEKRTSNVFLTSHESHAGNGLPGPRGLFSECSYGKEPCFLMGMGLDTTGHML